MAESNISTIRSFYARLDSLDFGAFDELCTSDFVSHFPGSVEPQSRELRKSTSKIFYQAFPDLTHSFEDSVSQGETVAVRLLVTGTHKSEFMGFAPTGKSISFTAMRFYGMVGGKIAEEWVNFDSAGLVQQLQG